MKNIFIDLLAFGTLFSSVLVITSKNPVIAVTFLIAVFVNAAGYLILKGIGFIGISYIIVYVGAITVLFLFVIMMINIKLTDILETGSQYTKNLPLALAIGSVFLYEIFNIMPFSLNNVSAISALLNILTNSNLFVLNSDISALSSIDPLLALDPNIADTTFTNFLQIQSIGQGLYTYGAIWLILSSIILLLAMVAPIFISRITKNDDNNSKINPFKKFMPLPAVGLILTVPQSLALKIYNISRQSLGQGKSFQLYRSFHSSRPLNIPSPLQNKGKEHKDNATGNIKKDIIAFLIIFVIVFFSSKNNLYLFWLKVGFCVVCALFVLHNLIIIYLMVKFSSEAVRHNAKVLVFPKYTPKFIKNFLTRLNKFSQIKETFNGLLTIYIKFSIVFFVVFIIFVLLLFI